MATSGELWVPGDLCVKVRTSVYRFGTSCSTWREFRGELRVETVTTVSCWKNLGTLDYSWECLGIGLLSGTLPPCKDLWVSMGTTGCP